MLATHPLAQLFAAKTGGDAGGDSAYASIRPIARKMGVSTSTLRRMVEDRHDGWSRERPFSQQRMQALADALPDTDLSEVQAAVRASIGEAAPLGTAGLTPHQQGVLRIMGDLDEQGQRLIYEVVMRIVLIR